jgi:hypothetical protein
MNYPQKTSTLGMAMSVNEIKGLSVVIQEAPIRQVISLDVVLERDSRDGAEGHAGMTGLRRQLGHPRLQCKTMRSKLAEIG